MATAFARAMHLLVDSEPAVYNDSLAIELLPAYQRRYLKRLGRFAGSWLGRTTRFPSAYSLMRAQIVVRARYAEDALIQARVTGVERYVVLAAGLDTFALRQSEPAIDVVEIDHPATQRWKRSLLAERGIPEPAELSFLPVDFERETLADAWKPADAPDFISWLGATYYLTREAIAATLTTLANCSRPGSELVLDFWREPPATDFSAPLLWGTRFAVALQQEPMHSFFDPEEICQMAASSGWQVRETCSPGEQDRRYLQSRSDRLSVPSFAWLLHLTRAAQDQDIPARKVECH